MKKSPAGVMVLYIVSGTFLIPSATDTPTRKSASLPPTRVFCRDVEDPVGEAANAVLPLVEERIRSSHKFRKGERPAITADFCRMNLRFTPMVSLFRPEPVIKEKGHAERKDARKAERKAAKKARFTIIENVPGDATSTVIHISAPTNNAGGNRAVKKALKKAQRAELLGLKEKGLLAATPEEVLAAFSPGSTAHLQATG